MTDRFAEKARGLLSDNESGLFDVCREYHNDFGASCNLGLGSCECKARAAKIETALREVAAEQWESAAQEAERGHPVDSEAVSNTRRAIAVRIRAKASAIRNARGK